MSRSRHRSSCKALKHLLDIEDNSKTYRREQVFTLSFNFVLMMSESYDKSRVSNDYHADDGNQCAMSQVAAH